MKPEPAMVHHLSAATKAIVSRRAVTLVRGREAFTLGDRETQRLAEALQTQPGQPSEPEGT